MTQPTTPYALSWMDVWTLAITRPRPETYVTLLLDQRAKFSRALLWLFLTGVVSSFVLYNVVFATPEAQAYLAASVANAGYPISDREMGQLLVMLSVCVTPLSAVFNLIGIFVLGGAIQLMADLQGAPERTKGKFKALIYVMGAIMAPMSLVTAFFNIVPILGVLAIVATVYQTFLVIRAAQAVYGFALRPAITVVVLPTITFFALQLLILGTPVG